MICLDEEIIELVSSRQQSSQVLEGVVENDQTSFTVGSQDIRIYGDNKNRHDNHRELLFQVNPCVPNELANKECVANPEAELAKMELVVLYNSESFNK